MWLFFFSFYGTNDHGEKPCVCAGCLCNHEKKRVFVSFFLLASLLLSFVFLTFIDFENL